MSTVMDLPPGEGPSSLYELTPTGVVHLRTTPTGFDRQQLSTFTVRITKQVIVSDGVAEHRDFVLLAAVGGQEVEVTIPARAFASMGWVLDALGPDAIVFPGGRDHLRTAIQVLSQPVPTVRVYGHIGWREIDGAMVYLTPAGAITATGLDTAIAVQPPETVVNFTLAEPPEPHDLVAAIRASLAIFDVAPDRVTVPLLGATVRSVLGGVDFGLFIQWPNRDGQKPTGRPGSAALRGAGWTPSTCPGSWLGTVNANEQLLFDGKDALMTIDDFNPVGSSAEVQGMHGAADRLFRAQGNRKGRQRMAHDLTVVPEKPPRGLLLATGEDIPRGHSLRARAVLVAVASGDIDWNRLTICQQDAATGRYAQAMTGYIQWIAGRYDVIQARLEKHRLASRGTRTSAGVHQRTPANLAQLAIGMEFFLEFALEIGAITSEDYDQYRDRVHVALDSLVDRQREEQAGSDQALRFVELLDQAIASGQVHVADRDGQPPTDGHQPSAWGWREHTTVVGKKTVTTWQPQGDRVGWLDGEVLYLKADLAYGAAQVVGRQVGDALTLTKGTLVKRLAEHGLLAAKDEARQTYAIRRLIEGRQQSVIAIAVNQLAGGRDRDNPDDAVRQPVSSVASVLRRIGVGR